MNGVANNFRLLCAGLRVSNSATISARYRRITRRLNCDFWDTDSEFSHSLYVGSYGRDTAINGFHDLDILFLLPTALYTRYDSYSTNGQSALLQAVRSSLLKTYPATSIGGDGQVVVVVFDDGMRFEVVPAFRRKGGSFYYPDTNRGGQWKITDPLPEIAAIREGNSLWNQNLKHLCRMARAWRRHSTVPMGGLHIDTLAHGFLKGWKYRDKSYSYYGEMMRDFLEYVAEQDRSQRYWLAVGSRQRVHKKGAFVAKARAAYLEAARAVDFQSKGIQDSAQRSWRNVFGNFYPAHPA